jgi:hypothetical protein
LYSWSSVTLLFLGPDVIFLLETIFVLLIPCFQGQLHFFFNSPFLCLTSSLQEVDDVEVVAVIDTGVASSVISRGLLEDIGMSAKHCINKVFVTADGKLRLCVNYRKLNAIMRKDRYPIPLIDEILDALGGATIYSTLDARSGYWQVPLATEEDKDKTAFAIPGGGFYRFRVMPFGLSNAPSTY